MQRRTRADERLPLEDLQVVSVSKWRSIPFLLAILAVLCYALYAGRNEMLLAAYGAKAMIVQSFTKKGKTVDAVTPVVLPKVPTKVDRLQIATAEAIPKPVKEEPIKYKGSKKAKVITTVKLSNNQTMEILDEPIPDDCYAEQHGDYDGFAVQWGLGHKARSAAECCRMCKEFKPSDAVGNKCNVWVWCGDPSGVCWTMDIHAHTTGDCWLKWQSGWDNVVDLKATNLKVNHRGRFSQAFRSEHKTAPEFVPWVAGLHPTGDPKPATGKAGGQAPAS